MCSRQRSTASCRATATMAFLRRRPGGSGAVGEDAKSLPDRRIAGLEADEPPGQLDQGRSEPGVAVLGHRAGDSFASGAILPGQSPV